MFRGSATQCKLFKLKDSYKSKTAYFRKMVRNNNNKWARILKETLVWSFTIFISMHTHTHTHTQTCKLPAAKPDLVKVNRASLCRNASTHLGMESRNDI